MGWIRAGEWLAYTVSVAKTASYDLEFRVAAAVGSGGTFHAEIDGANKTGPITLPVTGGWQSWTTVTARGVALTAGTRTLRIVFDGPAGRYLGNLNAFTAIEAGAGGLTPQDFLSQKNATVAEGAGTLKLDVRLSSPAASSVTVSWTATGTASYDGAQSSTYGSGQDFSPASGTVTFADCSCPGGIGLS